MHRTLASAAYLHAGMLQLFEHALQASNPDPPWPATPDPPRVHRGKITGFSPASRRRALRLLSTLRTSQLPPARFVTLTWHRPPDRWLADARAFLQWIRRRDGRYFWRLEAQQRGAPHLHLIVWCKDWNEHEAREHWSRIAAHGSEAHLEHGYDESAMESYGQVFAYVSKYIAKRSDSTHECLVGRRQWGASRDLPRRAVNIAPELSPREFAQLRRFANRLLRARRRTSGRRGRARRVSHRAFHLYLRAGDSERIADWLGVNLLTADDDPFAEWAEAAAIEWQPRPPPAPCHNGQHHFGFRHAANLR